MGKAKLTKVMTKPCSLRPGQFAGLKKLSTGFIQPIDTIT
jgi:hypothetical protein